MDLRRTKQNHHQIGHKRHRGKKRPQNLLAVHAPLGNHHRNREGNPKAHNRIANIKHADQCHRIRRKKAGHIGQCAKPDIKPCRIDDIKRPMGGGFFPRQQQHNGNRNKVHRKANANRHQIASVQFQPLKVLDNRHRQCNLQHELA